MSELRFGRYERLFRIASGGMAEVFAARIAAEGGFDKRFAIKRILPLLAEDREFVQMFLEEARIGSYLSSPNIVSTVDLGRTQDGAPFLVQDLVVGADLVAVVTSFLRRDRHLPLEPLISILAQAARGLHDAHEARGPDGRSLELVHRDVSPHNLLVGVDGRVRLTDFGIARVAFDRLVATGTGMLKGKYGYFSPEQSRGQTYDRRSDVFSLGVVAWELLTSARLFSAASPVATLERIAAAEIEDPRALRPDLPAPIAEAVMAALTREPEARTPTARALADALEEAARSAGLAPSDRHVAELMASLELPRVRMLEQRLRALDADPELETMDDIDAPAAPVDSGSETLMHDDDPTEFELPPVVSPDASTALFPGEADATIVESARPPSAAPLVIAAVMLGAGILLAVTALVLLLR